MGDGKLWLGTYLDENSKRTDKRFEISVDLLRRHGGVFGSTGSGKTVLSKVILEEAAMEGIPIVAFDPQGDIASLMLPGDPKQLKEKGVDPSLLKEYMEKVFVRVYTPASSKGLSISINPLKLPDKKKADPDDVIRLLDNSARTLVKVLAKVAGLSKSWEAKSFAALYELLRTTWENPKKDIRNLVDLANMLEGDKETIGVDLEPYMKQSERAKLATSIRSLTVGSSQLLFKEEGQLDFDEMVKKVNGKTPINVIFLKTLRSEEEKHFFIAIVLNQLYSWMLRQGFSDKPRMVLFQDEAAPFIPAGMKAPGPKETFLLLFRQARKYGIECLIATQSPKDIDYKAFEQFNTIAAGRISSDQSLKVLERILEPIAGEKQTEEIITSLPGQQTACFAFSSADLKPRFNSIGVRWLLTKHITMTERDVKKHMEQLVKQQQKILEEMAKAREKAKAEKEAAKRKAEEERRKEEERRRKEEEAKKTAEQKKRERLKAEEEKRKQEEAARKAREAELEKKKSKFRSAAGSDKVFDSKKAGTLSYDDLMQTFIDKLEKVAKKKFGIQLLRELLQRGELNFEKARAYYWSEVKESMKQKLAVVETKVIEKKGKKKKVKMLVYDFVYTMQEILKELRVKEPEYVDEKRLKKQFEDTVKRVEINNVLERIILGEPFLEF
jgi:hypothetical protein